MSNADKKKFNADFGIEMLEMICEMSDDSLATSLNERTREFLKGEDLDALKVWNYYKELLDNCVHCGGASNFVLAAIDLELFWEAPEGGYLQSDGSINSAPWRQVPAWKR